VLGGSRVLDALDKVAASNLSMVITLGRNGRIQAMSAAAREALGWPEPWLPSTLAEVLATGPGSSRREFSGLAVRSDGTPIRVTGTRRRVHRGLSSGEIVVLVDESGRERAEQRLRETESLLDVVVNAVTSPVAVRDEHGRFIVVNASMAATMGLSASEMLGRRTDELPLKDWASRQLDLDWQAASGGCPRTEDGNNPETGAWWSSNAYPICKPDGSMGGVVQIVRDVTEQRNHSVQIKDACDRAERAVAEKSRFLAAASHDLRQPVQALYLHADVLGREALSPVGATALAEMTRAADAMKGLLDGLLDLHQLDAGVVVPRISSFPLDEIFEQVEGSFGAVARDKGLAFDVARCGLTVSSDRTRLLQMIVNLVSNAIRYTDAGGIEVTARRTSDCIRIEVRDTGIGIPADRIPLVWGEFVQLGNEERDRRRGLGLGLSIVARLSRLLDHPVEVRSAENIGSTFFIGVPEAREVQPSEPRKRGASADGVGRMAVVVDDDTMVLTGIEAMMHAAGYAVVAAESADAAISQLAPRGICPDVLVADYRLREGRTGVDAIRAIREHLGSPVPAVLLTGENNPLVSDHAAEFGIGMLQKPLSASQLFEELSRVIGDRAKVPVAA
jgi:PAS domain S-box-containing protein